MSRLAVEKVAVLLEPVLDQLVLVGGCATAFLVPPPNDQMLRTTDDVDYIVPAFSYGEFAEWEDRLRQLGFATCPEEGVICRWKIGETRVDFMPVDGRALGFNNRWYNEAFRNPDTFTLQNSGLQVKVVSIPAFLATKFDAFEDRGEGEYGGNSDIEDIITVLAFRPECADLIAAASPEIRLYLREQARQLLCVPHIGDIIGGCFDAGHQGLAPRVQGVLRDIEISELSAVLALKIAELKALRAPLLTRERPNGEYEPIAFHVVMEIERELRRRYRIEPSLLLGEGLYAARIISLEQAEWLDEVRKELR